MVRVSLGFLSLLLLFVQPAFGAKWRLDPSTREAALKFFDRELEGVSPSGEIQVDRDHRAKVFPLEFEVPTHGPAFLCITTRATRKGRLTIHFQPATLPEKLKQVIPAEDWANPNRLYDFRVVVDLQPGAAQEHVISLNRDVFESVTRSKMPYDLAGIGVARMAFHLSVPVEAGQKFEVAEIKGYELTAAARHDYLAVLSRSLRTRLEELPDGSPSRTFWTPEVESFERRVSELPSSERNELLSWWNLQDELKEMFLKSRIWSRGLKSDSALVVGSVPSLIRISGRHEKFGLPDLDRKLRLEAAQNEFESFQIVLAAPRGPVESVRLRVSNLKQAGGAVEIDAASFALFEEIEQYIQPSPGTDQSQVGWLPDALLPVDGTIAVAAGEVKPIWVTLSVPPDTLPGSYAGQIKVVSSQGDAETIPVELLVHGFKIPTPGHFRTQGHLDLKGLEEWYPALDADPVRKNFYRMLLEHRFSPTSQYSARLSPEPADIPRVMQDGGTVILIGGFSSDPLDPEVIEPAYRWLVENGYIERTVIYIGDETDDFEGIRAKSLTIRRQWPQLRIMVGGSKPRDELIGYVDVWDPITYGGETYNFNPNSVAPALKRGEEVFWYTCVGPKAPFANVYNDHPLPAIRALWWQAWKYGVGGFEYWWFNFWRPNMELSRGPEPWPTGHRDAWNSRSYDWANGDGLLIYPGRDGHPLASLRLSVVRDAIEDWEVLFLLQRAVERTEQKGDPDSDALVAEAKAILAVPPEITSDLTHWSRDPQTYLGQRSDLYRVLSGLVEAMGSVEFGRYVAEWDRSHRERLQSKFEARVAETVSGKGSPSREP